MSYTLAQKHRPVGSRLGNGSNALIVLCLLALVAKVHALSSHAAGSYNSLSAFSRLNTSHGSSAARIRDLFSSTRLGARTASEAQSGRKQRSDRRSLLLLMLGHTLVTTLMRGRLDAENNTRDLLILMMGQRPDMRPVKGLGGSNAAQADHSLSKALLIVEEKAVAWARQLYSYYGATSGKTIDFMEARWLDPDNYPEGVERCKCVTKCKCLLFQHVSGVTEHLITLARGAIFKVNDEFDAVICAGCRHNQCHAFNISVYQAITSRVAGPLGPPIRQNVDEDLLIGSVSDLYITEEGNTGLIMLEPAFEPSVHWEKTMMEACLTKDAAEHGSENPFITTYRKALEGEESTSTGREEYADALWWFSRVGAFVLASALVLIFRTDAFSSVLLARRGLRGYIVDSTGTKLPLSTFCMLAQCYGVPGERRAFVVLKPKPSFILGMPERALWFATALEAIVFLLWIISLATTPWFHPVGSSYLKDQPFWAAVVCAIFVLLATTLNVVYYWQAANRKIWMRWSAVCVVVDVVLVSLTILLGIGVVRGHWIATIFRSLMMIGALLQWYIGVEQLGAITDSFRGATTFRIVPYALTYARLLALVLGGGRWA